MDSAYTNCEEDISYLKQELQQQRGMLWLFGEMMKAAISVSSFKELMATLSDMLMGVMGVTTCYLWIKAGETQLDDYTVFYRSIEFNNEFTEKKHSSLPKILRELNETKAFNDSEIQNPLISGINRPASRLAVPMFDFGEHRRFGMLVVEHEEADFFTNNTIAFFETFSIYIASNAQNSKMLQRISEQSVKDPLTGIYNRRFLSTALENMSRVYKNITIAVVDTDNFKHVNDEQGHLVGDIVLKGIAQLASGLAKECEGEVIRYGGDEFVLLIPKRLEEALVVLEDFRQGTNYLKVAYGLATDISVTLGVCAYPELLDHCGEALIRAADNALLRGKVKGKNRIVLAEMEDMA